MHTNAHTHTLSLSAGFVLLFVNTHSLSSQHIALAIGEEVDLQTRLLDDLADDVDVTQSRLKAATAKVKQLMRDSGNCRLGVCVFILIVTLVVVIILTVKLARFL